MHPGGALHMSSVASARKASIMNTFSILTSMSFLLFFMIFTFLEYIHHQRNTLHLTRISINPSLTSKQRELHETELQLEWAPTSTVDDQELIQSLESILNSSASGFLNQPKYDYGITTFVSSSSANLDLLVESIRAVNQIQTVGLGSNIASKWNIHATLFTTSQTLETLYKHLVQLQSSSTERTSQKIQSWPFRNLVLLDRIKSFDDIELNCCEHCCKKPLQGSKQDKWILKSFVLRNTVYNRTLYIDSDVFVCNSEAGKYLEMLDHDQDCEVFVTNDAQNGGGALETVPKQFFERNTGILFYDIRSRNVQELMDQYQFKYRQQVATNPSIVHDQPAFREALYELQNELKVCELPRNVHCRGKWMFKSKEALESTQCLFAHGDNRIRSRRNFRIPCKSDSFTEYYSQIDNPTVWE
mmetsp:Transcript_3578/g.6258  ORF Transcript_3578/g.6258 Transcript_3578/m.6258 type:complete len:415 (-) Transcript_3578:829-2073(-)